MSKTEVLAQQQVEETKSQVTVLVKQANNLLIDDQQKVGVASDILSQVKDYKKGLKDKKESITKPLNESLKNIRSLFAPLEANLDEVEIIIKRKVLAFNDEVRKKADAEKAKLEARLEKGTIKVETAFKKMADVVEPETKVMGNTGKLIEKTIREAVIGDENLIPREYFVLDMVKIRKVIAAGGSIPGVNVIEKKTIAGYGSR